MRRNQHCYLLLFLIIAASCTREPAGVIAPSADRQAVQRDRGFIVIAKEGAELETISEKLKAFGVKKFVLKEAIKELGLINVQTPDPTFPEKARKVADIQSVVVDPILNWRLPEKQVRGHRQEPPGTGGNARAQAAPVGDPYSFLQWGLNSVNAGEAWAEGFRGRGAKVAVLDGGFLLNDPEIAPNILLSHSFIDGEEVQYHGAEGFSHGTHVAGIIAGADNEQGIIGVAPEAKLILVKVLGDDGTGPTSALINGIYYAVVNGANVINMSLGVELPRKTYKDDNGTPDDPSDDYIVEYDRDIKDLVIAINRATLFATLLGTTCIAAAGNDGYDYDVEKRFITYPAAAAGVMCIAANGPLGWGINQDTTLYVPSIFTNNGKNFISYGAPGGNYTIPLNTQIVNVGGIVRPEYVFDFIFSIGGQDEASGSLFYVWAAGTSQAAPHASAVAALLYGKSRLMSPALVDLIFRKSVDDYGAPGKDKFFGVGQVNAGKAVRF